MILDTMKLNEQGKSEIRQLIESELRLVSIGNRVKLDKDLLEELLFFKVKYDKDKYLKLPVWGGDFLAKLDLSEVDFSDVSFAILYDIYMDKESDDFVYNLVKGKVSKYIRSSMVCYSRTNANIDFKESFEYKKTGRIIIHGFNFSDTDLSNNDIDSEFDIIHGYFKNTGLSISTVRDKSYAASSDFSGIDLSYYGINAREVDDNSMVFKNNCIMKNTKMNIIFDDASITELRTFGDRYFNGDFDGCYINGVLVKSDQEHRQDKLNLIGKYNDEVEKLKIRIKQLFKPYKVI